MSSPVSHSSFILIHVIIKNSVKIKKPMYYMVSYFFFTSHIVFQQHTHTTHTNSVASDSSVNWFTDKWRNEVWKLLETDTLLKNKAALLTVHAIYSAESLTQYCTTEYSYYSSRTEQQLAPCPTALTKSGQMCGTEVYTSCWEMLKQKF